MLGATCFVKRWSNQSWKWYATVWSQSPTKSASTFREVEPLDRAYFITRGTAWTYTTTRTNGEATPSSSQSKWLEKGGFFGEELIEWGLDLGQQASSDIFNLPLSAKIFKSHTKVEAYALMATDLKNIVSQINDAASKLHSALRHNKEN